MTLTFDSNGVQTNTFAEIFERLETEYKNIYGSSIDTDQESPDGQRIGIETTLRFEIETAIAWLYSQIDPDLNNGDMQQIIAKLAGIYMLAASRSQWDLVINMDQAKDLPSGYTITDNNNQNWFLDSDVTVSVGDNNVTFLASDWGAVSGVASGSSFTQSTPELGVVSISAIDDAVSGREEETEEAFRLRRKASVENPSQSTNGAIYAKLAQLPGVSDLVVNDNATNGDDVLSGSTSSTSLSAYKSGESISLDAHTMWVIIEGGSLDDIGEVMAKQRLGNTKGDIDVTYTDELTKPDGTAFFVINEHKIDRPDYVDLYIRLNVAAIESGAIIDTDAIKESLSGYGVSIGQLIQAGELYPNAYIDNFNYIPSDLEVSADGVSWTDQQVFAGYKGKFNIDTANITVTEV